MKNFTALTKSGTSYEARDGVLTIHPRNGFPYALKPIEFKSVDREALTTLQSINALPATELPELGKSIFAAGLTEWRLSTEVVKLEVVPA